MSPLLGSLHDWLQETLRSLSQKSAMAEAIRYALKLWAVLNRYTSNGQIEIDDTAAERALHTVALDRKNLLFAGSDAGGERATAIYSLIGSAKLCSSPASDVTSPPSNPSLIYRLPTRPNSARCPVQPDIGGTPLYTASTPVLERLLTAPPTPPQENPASWPDFYADWRQIRTIRGPPSSSPKTPARVRERKLPGW